jgi:hypothetical protein
MVEDPDDIDEILDEIREWFSVDDRFAEIVQRVSFVSPSIMSTNLIFLIIYT